MLLYINKQLLVCIIMHLEVVIVIIMVFGR